MTDDKTTPDNETPADDAELLVDTHVVETADGSSAGHADAALAAEDYAAAGDGVYADGAPAAGAAPTADGAEPAADDAAPAAAGPAETTADGVPVQHGVGPFSIREVALGGIWLLAFIVSFFPIYGGFGSGATVWNSGIDWVLTIGVPTAAVFLLALRRLSPQGIRRVGSLGIDQFASVAFSVSTVVWLGILWGAFVSFAGGRVFVATWVVWVEFFLMLAGVFLTVLAPFIAPFNEDFRHRRETVAHRLARPARPVTARPAPVPAPEQHTPAATDPYAAAANDPYGSPSADPYAASETGATGAYASSDYASGAHAGGAYAGDAAGADAFAPTGEAQPAADQATSTQAAAPAANQAFWALSPVERDVVDEHGTPLFTVGPTAWALVIEDRGDSFVVRHEDGRIGYLTDVSGVTRG